MQAVFFIAKQIVPENMLPLNHIVARNLIEIKDFFNPLNKKAPQKLRSFLAADGCLKRYGAN